MTVQPNEVAELISAFEEEYDQIEAPAWDKEQTLAGFFGCEINSSGIIWVYRFASEADLENWYNEKEAAFADWNQE